MMQTKLNKNTFQGFTIYQDNTKVIPIEIYKHCYIKEVVDGKKVDTDIGECVKKRTTQQMYEKSAILKKIVQNYETDIEAYNELVKD